MIQLHNRYLNYISLRVKLTCREVELSKSRLSIPFRFIRNGRNIPDQFKKQNKTEQISSHFKSRSVPDFSAKFRPERSGFFG